KLHKGFLGIWTKWLNGPSGANHQKWLNELCTGWMEYRGVFTPDVEKDADARNRVLKLVQALKELQHVAASLNWKKSKDEAPEAWRGFRQLSEKLSKLIETEYSCMSRVDLFTSTVAQALARDATIASGKAVWKNSFERWPLLPNVAWRPFYVRRALERT